MNLFDPGRLSERVTIERRTQQPGDFGHPVDTWAPVVCTVWANVMPIGGRERMAANAMQASLTHTVLVRWREELMQPLEAPRWRIRHGSRFYNIQGLRDVDSARRWIIFDCQEGGADGH
jgi:SPP1 family predicted phage head-tail adaptor